MSTVNVRRFIERVAREAKLANEIKAIPAGSGAEAAFAELGQREGFEFTVEELRQEAAGARAAQSTAESAARQSDDQSDDGLWVLDYFYGPEGKWTK
jgi:predicted ribosomally synthesized peptide with nif11-like leader